MALVQFEDLPSTDTAIDADNLNNNFSELREIYSTNEIKTCNTWMGKPIYRKIYTTYTTYTEGNITFIILDTSSIIEPINGFGKLTTNNVKILIPSYNSDLGDFIQVAKNTANQIYITSKDVSHSITDFYFVLEYTKTTD